MEKFLESDSGYALMHNFINEMVSGERVSQDALMALGMTGTYRPKPGRGSGKENAVREAANFLLSGFSNFQARDPEYNILINNGDGTFTRK